MLPLSCCRGELLIEPVWNWNDCYLWRSLRRLSAFNRTSMELKRGGFAHAMSATFSFNRTSMELKLLIFHPVRIYVTLLIEPVWNWNLLQVLVSLGVSRRGGCSYRDVCFAWGFAGGSLRVSSTNRSVLLGVSLSYRRTACLRWQNHWVRLKREARPVLKTLIRYVNPIFTFVFSRRDRILHLGNPCHAYVRKNLREASVKVSFPSEHL